MSLLQRETCLPIFIDIQERLMPAMHIHEALLDQLGILASGLSLCGIRSIVSEQYPKGLGHTLPRLLEQLEEPSIYEKTSFGIFGDDTLKQAIAESGKKQLLICGIESHVCVMQSALVALELGYEVFVPYDALSSRNPNHVMFALGRMEKAGATITNIESCLFEIMGHAKADEFKSISKLVR